MVNYDFNLKNTIVTQLENHVSHEMATVHPNFVLPITSLELFNIKNDDFFTISPQLQNSA